MRDQRTFAAAALAVLLAGCGAGDGDPSVARNGSAGTDPGSMATSSFGLDWARDACKTFPTAKAARAAGITLTGAEPGHGSEADGTANSTCNYMGEKDHFTIGLRVVTDGSETAASQIAKLADDAADMGPAVEIPAAAGQARWLPQLHQVIYYPDDMRTINVVPPGYHAFGKSAPEAEQQRQALAIALAAAAR